MEAKKATASIGSEFYESSSVLSKRLIKKNPSVYPVLGCIALGTVMAIAYTVRLAVDNPDVTWNSRKKPIPNNDYEKREYKLIQIEPFDPKTYEHPRPKF